MGLDSLVWLSRLFGPNGNAYYILLYHTIGPETYLAESCYKMSHSSDIGQEGNININILAYISNQNFATDLTTYSSNQANDLRL